MIRLIRRYLPVEPVFSKEIADALGVSRSIRRADAY
jgi:hypothetical protein